MAHLVHILSGWACPFFLGVDAMARLLLVPPLELQGLENMKGKQSVSAPRIYRSRPSWLGRRYIYRNCNECQQLYGTHAACVYSYI